MLSLIIVCNDCFISCYFYYVGNCHSENDSRVWTVDFFLHTAVELILICHITGVRADSFIDSMVLVVC